MFSKTGTLVVNLAALELLIFLILNASKMQDVFISDSFLQEPRIGNLIFCA